MHEHTFNQAVVNKTKVILERCGFDVLDVAPEDTDVPLQTRVDRANQAKADIYVSVHANALTGTWEKGGKGVECFYHSRSAEGRRLAELLQKHLLQGTEQVDRKARPYDDLFVIRKTAMVASLVECAFMDDEREAKLLLSDSFRQECAEDISKAICEYFSVPYVQEQPPTPKKPVEANSDVLQPWQKTAVEWAKANKVSDGTRPLDNITRVEVMAMIKNYHDNVKGK